jgi:hypothetical protein
MQQFTPNYIKTAIVAAGGRKTVSKALHVSEWTLTYWTKKGWMPPEHINRLCDMGGVVSPAQILLQIEAGKVAA